MDMDGLSDADPAEVAGGVFVFEEKRDLKAEALSLQQFVLDDRMTPDCGFCKETAARRKRNRWRDDTPEYSSFGDVLTMDRMNANVVIQTGLGVSVDSLSFLTWLRVLRWYLQGRLRRPSVRRRRPWWARRMTCLCRGRPLRNPAGGDIRRRAHLQQFAVKRGGGGCRREFALMAARARAGRGLGDTSASSARRSEFVVVRAHSCDQPHLSTNAHAQCKAIEEPGPGRRPEGWPDGSRCCAAATTAPMGAIRRVARGSLDEADYAAAGRSAPAMGLVRSARAMELARAVNRRQSWVRGNPRGRRGASYALAIGRRRPWWVRRQS